MIIGGTIIILLAIAGIFTALLGLHKFKDDDSFFLTYGIMSILILLIGITLILCAPSNNFYTVTKVEEYYNEHNIETIFDIEIEKDNQYYELLTKDNTIAAKYENVKIVEVSEAEIKMFRGKGEKLMHIPLYTTAAS